MKLIQRFKNLWKLSEWEPSSKQIEDLHETGRKFAPITKMAQIIRRETATEKLLKELKNETNG